MRSRAKTAGRLGAFAVVASMALPAAALGDEALFGSFDGYYGDVISHDYSATELAATTEVEGHVHPYDSQAADDFEVPARTRWHVRLVAAGGRFWRNVKVQDTYHVYGSTSDVWLGAADTPVRVRVSIHADIAGSPGVVLRTDRNGQSCGTIRRWSTWSMLTDEKRICGGDHGVLATRFEEPLTLGPGRYWVSFQVQTDPRMHGEWLWGRAQRTDQRCPGFTTSRCYGQAHWRNPGGGYRTVCTSRWGPVSDCIGSYRSPRCAATAANNAVPTPVCEERRPARDSSWRSSHEDLEMLLMGATTTTSTR